MEEKAYTKKKRRFIKAKIVNYLIIHNKANKKELALHTKLCTNKEYNDTKRKRVSKAGMVALVTVRKYTKQLEKKGWVIDKGKKGVYISKDWKEKTFEIVRKVANKLVVTHGTSTKIIPTRKEVYKLLESKENVEKYCNMFNHPLPINIIVNGFGGYTNLIQEYTEDKSSKKLNFEAKMELLGLNFAMYSIVDEFIKSISKVIDDNF